MKRKRIDRGLVLMALGVVLLVAIVTFSFWWKVAQWFECRAMDFSVFYCIQHAL